MAAPVLTRFSREEFLRERWDYQPGEHVFVCQPSQGGKTHWLFQLAAATEFPKPPVALVMKAVDPTPAAWTERLGWKETKHWPPPSRMPWQSKPPGYTLWPPHVLTMAPDALEQTAAIQEREFRKVFLDARRGGQAIIGDEVYGLIAELNLRSQIIEAVSRGSSAKSPLWYATQRPSGTQGISMPGHLFNCPTHLFLGFDPVEGNRKRFSEIGGINTAMVMDEVSRLQVIPTPTPHGMKPVSELLYINKNGPRGGYLCIVATT
jgi:hypothetical protein